MLTVLTEKSSQCSSRLLEWLKWVIDIFYHNEKSGCKWKDVTRVSVRTSKTQIEMHHVVISIRRANTFLKIDSPFKKSDIFLINLFNSCHLVPDGFFPSDSQVTQTDIF